MAATPAPSPATSPARASTAARSTSASASSPRPVAHDTRAVGIPISRRAAAGECVPAPSSSDVAGVPDVRRGGGARRRVGQKPDKSARSGASSPSPRSALLSTSTSARSSAQRGSARAPSKDAPSSTSTTTSASAARNPGAPHALRLDGLRRGARAGGVRHDGYASAENQGCLHGVPRGARLAGDDGHLSSRQRVQQRALSRVGRAHQAHARAGARELARRRREKTPLELATQLRDGSRFGRGGAEHVNAHLVVLPEVQRGLDVRVRA